jgi:ankyrin repeat protein
MELIEAVSDNNLSRVNELLQDPSININTIDEHGWTALLRAIREDNLEILNALLNSHTNPPINVNITSPEMQSSTPLIYAIINTHPAAVDRLLQVPGIDVNHINADHKTALMYACRSGYLGIVKLLLSNPTININLADIDDNTALLHACYSDANNIEIIRELLQSHVNPSIDVNRVNIMGHNAFLIICRRPEYVELIPFIHSLFTNPADINNEFNIKGLYVAIRSNNILGVQKLIESNIDYFHIYDYPGHTPLSLACENNQIDIVRILLPLYSGFINRYYLNRVDDDSGKNALIAACINGSLEIVNLLLEQPNIDVNVHDSLDFNPLMRAVESNRLAIVQRLLQHPNVNVNYVNPEDYSALKIAQDRNYQEIVALLIANGAINHEEEEEPELAPLDYQPDPFPDTTDVTALRLRCAVCMSNIVNTRFQCGHLLCSTCYNSLPNPKLCHLCREPIQNTSRIQLGGCLPNIFGSCFRNPNDIWTNQDFRNIPINILVLAGRNLSGSNFSKLDATRIDLSNSNLTNTNFQNANLSRANLTNANLTRANLSGANLSGTFYDNINFTQANLSGANLSGSTFFSCNFNNAIFSDTTIVSSSTQFSSCQYVNPEIFPFILGQTSSDGTPVRIVNVIPQLSPLRANIDLGNDDCAICLDHYNNKKLLVLVNPCHHIFHRTCIDNWITPEKRTCPKCKINIENKTPLLINKALEPYKVGQYFLGGGYYNKYQKYLNKNK